MNKFNPASIAAVASAVAACLLATGCGSGSEASNTQASGKEKPTAVAMAASAPVTTAAADEGYVVSPDELLINGSFTDGSTGWNFQDAALVNSQLRPGGKAMSVGWKSVQTLGANVLIPGRSYTLTLKARNEKTVGSAQLAVKFRRPSGSEVFRTYQTTISARPYDDYVIEFTAPEYVAMAEVSLISSGGTRILVDNASLKMREAISQVEPITSPLGSYVPTGYELAFNDEFNGTELNRDKWFTRYIYAGETMDRLNDEKQRYRDNNNHVVANGVLSLIARKVSETDPNGVNYESGMIRSDWTSRYGYYEARVKMPGGLGVWPAFWLNSDVSSTGRLEWNSEIDIFEFVNNGVEDTLNMIHSNVVTKPGGTPSTLSYSVTNFNSEWTFYTAPFNFNEGWHTIGTAWDANSVSMYVDGVKVYTRTYQWTYADGTLAGAAHILLNLAIGGSWAGRHGIDDTAFPQALQVDWVRAYRKAD